MPIEALGVDAQPVPTQVQYLRPMRERPRVYANEPPPNTPVSNAVYDPYPVHVHNMRSIADRLDFEEDGFCVCAPPPPPDVDDPEMVTGTYYPAIERHVRDITGASEVFVIEHVVRRHVPGAPPAALGAARQPVRRVHADYTEESGRRRVMGFQQAEALIRDHRHFQIVNVWRPLNGPVYDAPLAICSPRSVAAEDLVIAEFIYSNRVGYTYDVLHSRKHQWWYLRGMRTSEGFAFKCFDSNESSPTRVVLHTSFFDPTAPADSPMRESIEVRVAAFYK